VTLLVRRREDIMMRRRGPGLIRTAARTAVIAGTATAVSGRVAHRQQERYAQEGYEQQAEDVEAAPPSSTPPPQPAYVAELEKLAQLKAQGVITEDEFQSKKRQLLGL
jgi:hypothetical protein